MYNKKEHIKKELEHYNKYDKSYNDYALKNYKEDGYNDITNQVKQIMDSIICDPTENVNKQYKSIEDFYEKCRNNITDITDDEDINEINKSYLVNEIILKEVFNKNIDLIEKAKNNDKYIKSVLDELKRSNNR